MADDLAYHNPDARIGEDTSLDSEEWDVQDVITVLRTYGDEAEETRKGGPNPRDGIWDSNWDRYWGRYNTAGKAAWQSTHVMPESPMFVDRWAAAMREALDRSSEWYTVVDAAGKPSAVGVMIQKAMDVILSRCSRTPDGQVAGFSSVFEDQMKLGALMACCVAVTWEEDIDVPQGWPRVSTVDPREVHFDPRGRGLFRRRKYEIDKTELMHIAREADDDGDPIYDIDEIVELIGEQNEDLREDRERSTGTAQNEQESVGRKPITMEEWLATVIMPNGEVLASNALLVVANEKFLIRGPEENPFEHERDWIVFTPMIAVPLSIYGRSYMEDWSDVADAFVELTQLILDGSYTSVIKAFVANPDLLDDPTQLQEGISPNKIFEITEELDDLRRFIAEIDLGSLPQDVFQVWTALKTELREGAKLSEISLGQLAPNSRTTATEIAQVQQSGSAMIRTMARTIEERFIEPTLERLWKTALQHMDFLEIADVIGVDAARMFNERREEFIESSFKIQVKGISGIVDRQQRLQNLLTALQVIGQNQFLAQELLTQVSPQKLVETLFSLFNIDTSDLQLTEREQLFQRLTRQLNPQQQQPGGGAQGRPAGIDLAQ